MAQPPDPIRSQTFVIRLRRDRGALRGQVVSVATGAARLFEDLGDAMAFILAEAGQGGRPAPRNPAPARSTEGPARRRR